MRDDIPIPGSSKARLIAAGLRQFSQTRYEEVDVDSVAAEAGVTTGSLYHHFQSKKAFYGVLRDDMTRRVLDRMEAVAESVAPGRALKVALLAAYDGVLRIQAGKLLTEPDPRGSDDAIAALFWHRRNRRVHRVAIASFVVNEQVTTTFLCFLIWPSHACVSPLTTCWQPERRTLALLFLVPWLEIAPGWQPVVLLAPRSWTPVA